MRIAKKAGAFEAEAYTDGWPIFIKLTHGDTEIRLLEVDDLRDLQYVVSEMIGKIDAEIDRNR